MSKAASKRQIEQVIAKIEARYAMGKQILRDCGPVSPHGQITRLAAENNISRDMAQKVRAMADPLKGYTKLELNAWFREFRKAEFALTISHFVKLISVPRGRTRDSLTRNAIRYRWSSHRLQAEIISKQGRRQVGGRRPKLVTGTNFERELSQTLWSWSRWLGVHLEKDESMRSEIAKELKSLQRKISRLQVSLDAE
ncbi:hypothetical protein N9B53_01160 [Mariniblastus sp.]|nr:hypothetical protein [Mariniblastus sp.]